jgi:hypothetical protein
VETGRDKLKLPMVGLAELLDDERHNKSGLKKLVVDSMMSRKN